VETDGELLVDCFRPTPTSRVLEAIKVLEKNRQDGEPSSAGAEETARGRFTHYRCLTLPHLLALILRPSSASIPGDVAVVVLDSLTALVNSALPKPTDSKVNSKSVRGKKQGLLGVMQAL
jgi:hypothetical protein